MITYKHIGTTFNTKICTFLVVVFSFLLFSASVFAQNIPKGFNYQGVARDSNGYPIANRDIAVVFSIYIGDPQNQTVEWQEVHEVTTNEAGFFSLVIGEGTTTTQGNKSSFDNIDWTAGEFSVGVKVDFGDSPELNKLVDMGTAELQSVPYSFWSRNSLYSDTADYVKDLTIERIAGLSEPLPENNALIWNGTQWTMGTVSSGDFLMKDGSTDLTGDWTINSNNITLTNGTLEAKILQGSTLKLANAYEVNEISFDPLLGGDNADDITIPTQNAVKQYVDGKLTGGNWTADNGYLYNMDKKIGIGTAIPKGKLHIELEKEPLLAIGEFDAAMHIGNWGGGTRFAFYPSNASLRAGFISAGNNFWDDTMVGDYSVAFGKDTRATHNQSFAMGLSTTAGASGATAFGRDTRAFGPNSFTVGNNTETGGANAAAFGMNTLADKDYSFALGNDTKAYNEGSFAGGYQAEAKGNYSFSLGNATKTYGEYSFANGGATTARGKYSAAFGYNTYARTYAEFVIGQYNTTYDHPPESFTQWSATDRVFVIGNGIGTDVSERSDAMVVLKNGNTGIGISQPTALLHVGGNIVATGSVSGSSDKRFKKNINQIDNALPNVLKMKAVTYNWRTDEYPELNFTDDKQIGFIAQDLEKIYPELVLTDDNGYKSIDYPKLTVILAQAIKEQQKQIDALTKQNAELKAEVDNTHDLRNSMKEMQAKIDLLMQVMEQNNPNKQASNKK